MKAKMKTQKEKVYGVSLELLALGCGILIGGFIKHMFF